jgi:hypothetical protein
MQRTYLPNGRVDRRNFKQNGHLEPFNEALKGTQDKRYDSVCSSMIGGSKTAGKTFPRGNYSPWVIPHCGNGHSRTLVCPKVIQTLQKSTEILCELPIHV